MEAYITSRAHNRALLTVTHEDGTVSIPTLEARSAVTVVMTE